MVIKNDTVIDTAFHGACRNVVLFCVDYPERQQQPPDKAFRGMSDFNNTMADFTIDDNFFRDVMAETHKLYNRKFRNQLSCAVLADVFR